MYKVKITMESTQVPDSPSSYQPENDKSETSNLGNNTCNPSLSSELQAEEIAIMKGDAIGDTLYSERFVLSTLIQLTKDVEFNETFEKELCTFWDMTIERDVVLLLLQHNSLELIASVIQNSSNNRFIEILIGIVANMSCLHETRKKLCCDKRNMRILLEVINTQDSLILIQLMRFITSTLVFENTGDESIWFEHFEEYPEFIGQLAFILCNSTNSVLLVNTLEALIAMCAKFVVLEAEDNLQDPFMLMFVKREIVSGVIEAFKQTMPMQLMDGDDTNLPTQKQQKICNLFLEINCILTQYAEQSIHVYEEFLTDIFSCMNIILHPLTKAMYLIPFSQNSQGIIENVTEILSSLNEPLDVEIVIKLFKIWNLAEQEIAKLKQDGDHDSWEKEADNSNNSQGESLCGTNISTAISDYFIKILKAIPGTQLENIVRTHFTFEMTQELNNKFKTIDSQEVHSVSAKLETVINKIWTSK